MRRGNAEDAERMRQDLARAAVELAEEKGAAAVTVRAVAARLGISAMTPYRYLDNDPSQLLNGIWLKVLGELQVELAAANAVAGTARTRLRRVVESLIRFWQDRPDYFALLHGFDRVAPPSAGGQIRSAHVYASGLELQRRLTEDLAREIGAGTEHVKIACDIMLAMVHGYLTGTMVNRRYPWSDATTLLPAYLDSVVHAVEKCLMGDALDSPVSARSRPSQRLAKARC